MKDLRRLSTSAICPSLHSGSCNLRPCCCVLRRFGGGRGGGLVLYSVLLDGSHLANWRQMDALPSQQRRLSSSIVGGPARLQDSISLGRTNSSSSTDSPSYAGSVGASGSQSLASILNNPHASRSDAPWSTWWPSGAGIAPAPDLPPSIVPSTPIPEVNFVDFQPYIKSIFESYAKFEDVRKHSNKEIADGSEIKGQGEALVACLREVPSLFFKEDFALEDGATFRAACPFSPIGLENSALQEKLSHYLDVVELHLVKEISLRSDSFFEAQGQLQGLHGEILEACMRIRGLKETIRILNVNLIDSARQVQELNATRSNLVELQQKLTVILYVSQALSALKLVAICLLSSTLCCMLSVLYVFSHAIVITVFSVIEHKHKWQEYIRDSLVISFSFIL